MKNTFVAVSNSHTLNKVFNLLIIYYWGMIYLQKQEGITNPTLIYLMLVLPIGAFVFISLFYIKRKTIPKETIWIVLFIIISVLLSASRLDFGGMMSAILFGSALIVIFYYKFKINLRLLNILFLISIVLSIPLFYSGYSIYGFLPGQSHTNHLEILAGRVSLFPNVSKSIYFSLMVFILNFFFNKSKSKSFFLGLSFYYIYFGISRTTMLVLFLMLFIYFISKKFPIKNNFLYRIVIPIILIAIPILLIVNIENIILFLLNLHNDFISNYFFRGYQDVPSIMADAMRINIWSEHTRVFLDNPWGVSASEASSYVDKNLIGNSGSESFLTRILMRYGMGTIFLFIFLFSLMNKSMSQRNIYMYIFVFLFIFIGLNYGSFFNVYNVLFLIFISSINLSSNEQMRQRNPDEN